MPDNDTLPTIGHYRRHGQSTLLVYCVGTCSNSKAVSYDAIGLPDDTPFLDIAKRKSFRCERCGNREVELRPNWPDPQKKMAMRNQES